MRSIRRPLVIGTVLSALVALPALFARPWADERFVMYMPEKLVGGNPLLLWDQVMREVTAFIDVGVFRPLSRLSFYLEHWLVVRTGVLTGIAPNVVMSVVKVAMIALLLATGLATVDQYRRAATGGALLWRRTMVLLPVVFAGSLVLVNPAVHPLTLFPGLYLGTAVVALSTPLWFGRAWLRRMEPIGRRRWIRYGGAALLGAVLASMIELAWLGLPLALAHLVLLHVRRHGWGRLREIRDTFAFRIWILMLIGFAVVFLPARFFIAHYCSSGGCYDAAAPAIGGRFFALLPFRIGSAFAPVGLLAQVRGVFRLMTHPSAALAISFLVGVMAASVLATEWHLSGRNADIARVGDRPTPRTVTPVALYYAIVILLGAAISAISSGLQEKGLNPAPWRETGFGWVAWAVLISLALAVVAERLTTTPWLVAGLVLFVLTFTATTVINREDMRRVGLDEEGMLHIRAGQQLVDFDPTGNASRCATIAGLRDVAVNESELRKMNLVATYLDAAAQNNYGTLFCDPASS
jgi:hypothetical protein